MIAQPRPSPPAAGTKRNPRAAVPQTRPRSASSWTALSLFAVAYIAVLTLVAMPSRAWVEEAGDFDTGFVAQEDAQ